MHGRRPLQSDVSSVPELRVHRRAARAQHHDERRRPGGHDDRHLVLDRRAGPHSSTCSTTTSSASVGDAHRGSVPRLRRASPSTVQARPWPDRAPRRARSSCARTSPRPTGIRTRPSARSRSAPRRPAFRFASNNEFEEHQVVVVPAGGSASLSYVYSVGYSVADVTALALAAQDRFQGPSIVIGSPSERDDGLHPDRHPVRPDQRRLRDHLAGGRRPVGPGRPERRVDRASAAQPGHEHDHRLATDGAGATAQVQIAVVYTPPPPATAAGPPPGGSVQGSEDQGDEARTSPRRRSARRTARSARSSGSSPARCATAG